MGLALRCVVLGAWWGGVGCAFKEHRVHPATSASPRARPTRRMHQRLLRPTGTRAPAPTTTPPGAPPQRPMSMLPRPTGSRAPAPTVTPRQGASVPVLSGAATGLRVPLAAAPPRPLQPSRCPPVATPHTSPSPTSPPPGARELPPNKTLGTSRARGLPGSLYSARVSPAS